VQKNISLCVVNPPDIISEKIERRLRWLGHVERMTEERTVKKNTPEGKSSVGKPRKRWLNDVKNDLKKNSLG
jgi:hypothetical protein